VFLIECRPTIIALMTEAARTSETSVDIQLRTRQYIPEDSELYFHCHVDFEYSQALMRLWLKRNIRYNFNTLDSLVADPSGSAG
jgi:hypothetical protein